MGLDSDILGRAGAVKFSPDACSTAKKTIIRHNGEIRRI